MTDTPTLAQEDLHAYVDGHLAPGDEARIEAWLADHPDDAAAVHAYRLQNSRLRETFDAVLHEAVPPALNATVMGRRPVSGPSPWFRMAASVVLVLAGGLAGWLLHDWQMRTGNAANQAFVKQAVGAHGVFVAEVRHPVEVPASQEKHLVAWLSKRLGTVLRAPDMKGLGFDLVGGRLLSDGARPAAQFMYQNADRQRLTVYVRAADGTEDTAFRYISDKSKKGHSAFYWIDRKFAFALVAPMAREALMPIANKIYQAQQDKP